MAQTYKNLIDLARTTVNERSVAEVKAQASAFVLIDIREPEEIALGIIPGARTMPRGFLEQRIEEQIPDKDQQIVIYCSRGSRSLLAARAVQELGYRQVASLAGGIGAWKQAGFALDLPQTFARDLRVRYDRHLRIPEVGESGQTKLMSARALLIGSGALGSPATLYLAAAGVGTLGIVDSDVVDESNLQRQVLHATDRVGMPKVESAAQSVRALNPHVRVIKHPVRLTRENALQIFADYDVIIDGSDNFPTRYLVNDACVKLSKPCVHGSVYRFEGQASVFWPAQGGPCYRCLFPAPPPAEFAPSCDEAGVLGVLPGVIGCIEATEAIKILLGLGNTLMGRMLTYDALNMTFNEFTLHRNPECTVCRPGANIELIDYAAFCASK